MKLKQTIVAAFLALCISTAYGFLGQPVIAKTECAGVTTSIIACGDKKKDDPRTSENESQTTNGVWQILLQLISIMTGLVGLLAIGGVVYGSILYATAEDKEAQVQKAKTTIFNVVIGLVLYTGMFAILQFLIPGGIFR